MQVQVFNLIVSCHVEAGQLRLSLGRICSPQQLETALLRLSPSLILKPGSKVAGSTRAYLQKSCGLTSLSVEALQFVCSEESLKVHDVSAALLQSSLPQYQWDQIEG